MAYSATARRDGRSWILQCVEEPGAITRMKNLDVKSIEMFQTAIAAAAKVPKGSVHLDQLLVQGLPGISEGVSMQAYELRSALMGLDIAAGAWARETVASLREAGIPIRDIGVLLHVSHQRIQQISAEPAPVNAEPAIKQVDVALQRMSAAVAGLS